MTGIIGAMEIEVKRLVAQMENEHTVSLADLNFHVGRLCGQDVTIVVCGIGKVCAAVCTQILIDRFGADRIINTGIAGGLDDRLKVCDIVIATDAVQHDFDLCVFGYAKGHLPCSGGEKSLPSRFSADANLSDLLKKAADLHIGGSKYICGTVVSGDQFICEDNVRAYLKSGFGAAAAEMEGASIAQTCFLNRKPFAIIRAISDLAGDNAGISYDKFEEIAAERSAAIISDAMRIATESSMYL